MSAKSMPARRTLLARLLWRGNSQRNRDLSGAGRSGTSIASVRRFPSLRPGSFPGMALDRATTIGEPAETLVAPFERKGGIRHEAGVSLGRYQIFPNTRCLSGVKCLSDESCSSVVDHSQIHLRGTYSADNVQAVPCL
jgi:hypothetical protein